MRAYVPLADWDRRPGFYGPSRFPYDAARDEYRCPQGHPLRRHHPSYRLEAWIYRADRTICAACPVRAACTTSRLGRSLTRSFSAAYFERVRAYEGTPAYEKALRKRKVWVEPLFGEAKQWHGLRRFRLRRLPKVNTEALLTAAGQNLKRLLQRQGWGRRRHDGCLPASPGAPITHRAGLRQIVSHQAQRTIENPTRPEWWSGSGAPRRGRHRTARRERSGRRRGAPAAPPPGSRPPAPAPDSGA